MLGIMSGFFWTYSINISRAFKNLDENTYAIVQSLCNIHVRNWSFYSFFFGTGLMGVVNLIWYSKDYAKKYYYFILLAVLLYLFGIIIYTKNINLPLNYYTESWVVGKIPSNWIETRNNWNKANNYRTICSFVCFISIILAFFLKLNSKIKK